MIEIVIYFKGNMSKQIVFLSSLNNKDQRGGAYLRVNSIRKVLKEWNFEIHSLYQHDIKTKGFFSKLFGSIRFGKEVKPLFTHAHVSIPDCEYLILDNFRQLHWNFDFQNKHNRPRVIYNAHNLEFENHFGKVSSQKRRRFALYEAIKMQTCDLIFVCSEREKDILIELNPRLLDKILVFPNLVDHSDYKIDDNKAAITFLGTLDYFPNIEAVEFICGPFFDALPVTLQKQIVIAGRNPTATVKTLCASRGIELRTNLSDQDIQELLAKTKISLVPLVSGSGTRLKIIESLFSEAIVLSTPMGAEGVDCSGIVLSELDQFGSKCTDLFENSQFSDLCPPDISRILLNSYDCFSWAKIHKEEFLKYLV